MRIALTGGTGLIGSAIAAALETHGHSLLRIGRGAADDVRLDLARPADLPPAALAGCAALIHAAGVTDEDFGDRAAAFAKSLEGARALLAAATEARVAHLVYVSSAHVYGPLEGAIDESRAANPLSDYALAHFATEQMFRRAALATGATALLVRPCAVYGMPRSLERFTRWSLIPFDFPRQAVSTGEIVLLSHGAQRRNFVSAEGLARLAGWWLDAPRAGVTVCNAPGPSEMSVYDFALMCAEIAGAETGRACEVRRPAAPGPANAPLEYRTRVAGHLPGPDLEDHVRTLVRALTVKAKA